MYVKTLLRLVGCCLLLIGSARSHGQLIDDRGLAAPEEIIDLEISLYTDEFDLDYPRGDLNGNHQSFPLSEQDKYEVMVQHFADAIFEITEGKHEIRDVTIHMGGNRIDASEIVWVRDGQPNLNFSAGRNFPQSSVVMSDVFTSGAPGADVNFLSSDAALKKGGFVLAHRWVQFHYGLLDEWKRNPEDIAVSSTLMSNPYEIGFDSKKLSIEGDGMIPWFPQENTRETLQQRRFFSSAWDTLRRHPFNDPKYPKEIMFSPRKNNSEMTAPNGDFNDRERLLNIIWKQREFQLFDDAHLMFVIDVSGSMGVEKLTNLKEGLKFMGELAYTKDTNIGIIVFGDEAKLSWSYGKLESEQQLFAFDAAVDSIEVMGQTNMTAGLTLAMNHLRQSEPIEISYVVLVSDGGFNAGGNPFGLIPQYVFSGYRILSAYYPPGLKSNMVALADGTSGYTIETNGNFSELESDFYRLFKNPIDPISVATYKVPGGSKTINKEFHIPSLAESFSVIVQNNGPAEEVRAELRDPNGDLVESEVTSSGHHYSFEDFVVEEPMVGYWTLDVIRTPIAGDVELQIDLLPGKHEPVITIESLYGPQLEYPTPMLLQASLSRGDNLNSGDTLSGTLHLPSGGTENVTFRDDGVFPDPVGGDGDYTLQYDYSVDGEYRLEINVDTRITPFMQSNLGSVMAPAEGSIPYNPATVPAVALTEPVLRTKVFTMVVSDSRPDDHSGDYREATEVELGNLETPGRFETINDLDYFKFNAGEFETATVRVTNVGKNISDYAILVSGLNVGGLFDVWGGTFSELNPNSSTGYPYNNFEVFEGQDYYISIQNLSGETEHTNYQVSVGSLLPNEVDLNPNVLDGSGDETNGGGGGGGCVITTVALGTPLVDDLDMMRGFRDRFLLSNGIGSEVIASYYRVSPYWAAVVREQPLLKAVLVCVGMPMSMALNHPEFCMMLVMTAWMVRRRKSIRL